MREGVVAVDVQSCRLIDEDFSQISPDAEERRPDRCLKTKKKRIRRKLFVSTYVRCLCNDSIEIFARQIRHLVGIKCKSSRRKRRDLERNVGLRLRLRVNSSRIHDDDGKTKTKRRRKGGTTSSMTHRWETHLCISTNIFSTNLDEISFPEEKLRREFSSFNVLTRCVRSDWSIRRRLATARHWTKEWMRESRVNKSFLVEIETMASSPKV